MKLAFLEKSRIPGRAYIFFKYIIGLRIFRRRQRPNDPRNVWIIHNLLLGDTIMLAGLIAKLRTRFPDSNIHLATPPSTVSLFTSCPYNVKAHAFNPRSLSSIKTLFLRQRPDIVYIPAENRYSILAAALGAAWIVGFEGDSPAWKNWLVDELHRYPDSPSAWPDIASSLVEGPPPNPFIPGVWPTPPHKSFDLPKSPYCVLHVGASSTLRHWRPEFWRMIANWLTERGFNVVWSGGPGEETLVEAIDPNALFSSYAGKLDLAQLWHLFSNANLLISPDTGVAHLGKACGVPCVTLFGPGSSLIYGTGSFWSNCAYRAVTVDNFPCRTGRMLFERTFVPWVKHCAKSSADCPSPECMYAIKPEMVTQAISELFPKLIHHG